MNIRNDAGKCHSPEHPIAISSPDGQSIQFQEENSEASQNGDTGEIENVRVVVRVRPMDKAETDVGSANVVKIDKQNRCVTVTKPNTEHGEPPRIYYFDNVFAEDSTQVSEFCLLLMADGCVYLHFIDSSKSSWKAICCDDA